MKEPPLPWERQPGESVKAFTAFLAYRDLGPDARSLRELCKVLGKGRTMPNRWSMRWHWGQRVAAWDEKQILDREAANERARILALQNQAERQSKVREVEWSQGEALLERAASMLKFPLVRQTPREERYTLDEMRAALEANRPLTKAITTVEPVRWNFWTGMRAAEVASRLMRLSCGLPAQAVEVSGPGGGPVQHEVTGNLDLQLHEVRKRARELLAEKVLNERLATTARTGGPEPTN